MDSNNLIIRAYHFGMVAQNPDLMKTLYSLTLYGGNSQSGSTYELDQLTAISKKRVAKARILTASRDKEIVGWSLLSREPSKYMNRFQDTEWFNPLIHGTLFEVYVKPSHRRTGIATELLKVARRKAQPHPLCFVPWDYTSREFYKNFKHYDHRII